ncbi:MAG: hypothetical protein F4W95_06155 [Chloroflexi bacterium]|nr:hypothetical protein [Chloroflexota bacterium]
MNKCLPRCQAVDVSGIVGFLVTAPIRGTRCQRDKMALSANRMESEGEIMGNLNVANRTLAVMDNLAFLRRLNNECIDLIAIDPPFAANETFTGNPRPPISDAEFAEEVALAQAHGVEHNEGQGETRVHDIWSWDEDVHPAWKMRIEDDYPSVHAVIQAVEACASENEAAYIAFMAARLLECRRVLKPTGSIYVHCDGHANSYLRMLMDAVFGSDSYRAQITWQRTSAHNDSRTFGNVSDTILFYSRQNRINVNDVRVPLDSEYVERFYRHEDERGKFRVGDLTAAELRYGETGQPWREYDPNRIGRHWAVPMTGNYAAWIESNAIPGYRDITSPLARLDALDEAGFVFHPASGGMPSIKRYLDSNLGQVPSDMWTDIRNLSGQSAERTGYATQKPLELYERIIKASSDEGDVVLDIFAGCATTAVAAERLGRQWVACDMAYRAWTMLKRRFLQNGWKMSDTTNASYDAMAKVRAALPDTKAKTIQTYTIGPNELPERDDVDPDPHHYLRQARRGARQSTQSSSWSGRISKDDAKQLLIRRFGPVCWGCGYEPRRPNGSLDETLLEVDHIRARKATQGAQGNDELYNLALLHRTCNGIKRNQMTLEQLREHNAMNSLLYVNTINELVDLYEATQFAAEQIAIHTAKYGLQTELTELASDAPEASAPRLI